MTRWPETWAHSDPGSTLFGAVERLFQPSPLPLSSKNKVWFQVQIDNPWELDLFWPNRHTSGLAGATNPHTPQFEILSSPKNDKLAIEGALLSTSTPLSINYIKTQNPDNLQTFTSGAYGPAQSPP